MKSYSDQDISGDGFKGNETGLTNYIQFKKSIHAIMVHFSLFVCLEVGYIFTYLEYYFYTLYFHEIYVRSNLLSFQEGTYTSNGMIQTNNRGFEVGIDLIVFNIH